MKISRQSGNQIFKLLIGLLLVVAFVLVIVLIVKSCDNNANNAGEPGASPTATASDATPGGNEQDPTQAPSTTDGPGESPTSQPTDQPTAQPTNDPELKRSDYMAMPRKAPEKADADLVISEVMSSNTKYAAVSGSYYDWVEITNISNRSIELSDYTLTDRQSKPEKYRLPSKTVAPGEYVLIYCSGLTQEFHAPFKISSDGEALYIFKDGKVVDNVIVPADLGTDNSYARYGKDWIYSVEPTPGAANAAGKYRRLAAPKADVASGYYGESVKVTLSGSGKIYYTVDGTEPSSKSKTYSGPIDITKPTSLRVVCIDDGETSAESSFTYVVDKTASTLPIMNIAVDMNLLTGEDGVFSDTKDPFKGTEAPVMATLIENGEVKFSVPCGFKLNGNDSRKGAKQSFKLRFKSTYGPSKLNYKVFDDLDIDTFDSLVLRGGSEDFTRAMFRDEVCAEAFNGTTNLYVQAAKPVILYIGGEYWGLYFIRERLDEDYVEEHFGVDAESVELVESNIFVIAGSQKDYQELVNFCKTKDLSVQSNFDYVKERVDLIGLIDWNVCRSFLADHDTGNTRIFKSAQGDNIWRYTCFDLDWSFSMDRLNEDTFQWYIDNSSDVIFKNLMKAPQFKKMLMTRFNELRTGALSASNILAKIDKYEALVINDIERDRIRWGSSLNSWKAQIENMRKFINSGRLDVFTKNMQKYAG